MVVERVVNRLRWGTAQNMGRGEVSTTAFADPTAARMLTLMAAKHASPPSGEDFEFDMLTEFLRFMGKCTAVEQYYSLHLILEACNRLQFSHANADVRRVRGQDVVSESGFNKT